MATLAHKPFAPGVGDERFFVRAAVIMAITIVCAFAFQYLMGRSTFASPIRVHIHAFFFMGWVAIYLTQNLFVGSGRMELHKRLGWIGAVWIAPMIIVGSYVTVIIVRLGHVPFFFRPAQFLIFDPMTVFTFAALSWSAIVLRRRTEWHRRLHFCGMSMLLVPAFGRLLPLPLLQPWAWEAAFAASMLFPVAGVIADVRRSRRIHPAWNWGIATMLASFVLTELITYSPVGTAIYAQATKGSPAETIAPLDFGTPAGPLITGRR